MKILVTGGAGYIGSHTVVELVRSGHDVCIFDDLSNGKIEAIHRIEKILEKKIQFIKGDIRQLMQICKILCEFRPDVVIHFAALKAVSESVQNPLKYYEVNVSGTITLLQAMDLAGCKACIFSSSATVYGIPQFLPLNENHPTNPINPYGRTKLVAENLLQDWCFLGSSRRAVCLRYFNPIGADKSGFLGENPTRFPNNVMPFLTDVALGRRDKFYIFGDDYDTRDGSGERDYIHVSDLAICHVKAAERLEEFDNFEVMNVGTGIGTTVFELLKTFEEVSGKTIVKEIIQRRLGDVATSWTDTSIAQSKLNYVCEKNVRQACADVWNWLSLNPNGY